MSIAIVWFRNDLRLHDHEPLIKALKNHDQIIPFYCFDKKDFGTTSFGFEKTGNYRAQFLVESIQNIRKNLKHLGSNLVVRFGDTAEELRLLSESIEAVNVYTYKDIHSEERDIQKSVEEKVKGTIHYSFGSTLFHINDLPFSYKETPKTFTQFRKEVEKKSRVRDLFSTPKELPSIQLEIDFGKIPSLSDLGLKGYKLDSRAVFEIKGGEDAAVNRLQYYFYETEELSFYKEKRNGLLGANYSSKFSLWLWNGCISPRKIYWEVEQYKKTIIKNQSTYWLIFELIWRDYFKFISLKHGNSIFQLNGIKDEKYKWDTNQNTFQKWAEGETGIPFIDANMKELNQTGFMSNRGRQNVASFLVKELGLDWRMGAEYFESKLIDYDVASNYGNWMYLAGVGNDPRDRYFNIILQAKRYDPKGKYVKHWISNLADVDEKFIHHPWTIPDDLFGETKVNYPKPIAEPNYWKKYY